MGTIEKRGENSWRIGERLPTSQGRGWVRRTLTFPSTMTQQEQRSAAELELARLMVDIADGRATAESPLTVRQLADIWFRDHVDVAVKPTTAATYHHLMEGRILPLIGDIPVHQLKPLDITRALNEIRQSEKKTTALPPDERKRVSDRDKQSAAPQLLSDRTVRHYYDVMNYMFNKGVQWQLIRSNPLEHVDRPKARRKRLVCLDDDQAVDLLRKLALEDNLSFRCAVLLALLCGLRLGEVGGLYLSDVNFDKCTITINQALHYVPALGNYMDTTKSSAGEREIALPAGMMTLLESVRDYQQETAALIGDRWRGDGRIVCNWDGSPQHHDTPSKQFRAFADKHGFEGVRFQDLRHAHASILFANNMDAVSVAQRMGHESPDTTFRNYAHAIQRRDKESAAALNHLLERAQSLDSE